MDGGPALHPRQYETPRPGPPGLTRLRHVPSRNRRARKNAATVPLRPVDRRRALFRPAAEMDITIAAVRDMPQLSPRSLSLGSARARLHLCDGKGHSPDTPEI